MEFNFKTFDLTQTVNSIIDTINPILSEKKLTFTLEISDLIKKNIYSDEATVRQILLNLLSNAIKFTESGSIKLIITHPNFEVLKFQNVDIPLDSLDSNYLLFSVSDTGIGISENDINVIFDEYRQLDRSLSKKYGGTGLGLALTKKMLGELNGKIWVNSELSKGSTFNFIIPVERPTNPEIVE